MSPRCAICGGKDDEAHASQPHFFEPAGPVQASGHLDRQVAFLLGLILGMCWAVVLYFSAVCGGAS